MRSVEYCQISPTLRISRVITGLWQIADLERSGELDIHRTANELDPYISAGLSTFDMADHYGSSEEIVGIYHQKYPSKGGQFLTKWVPSPEMQTREDVRAAVEKSLSRMKSDRLDMLQFHAWNYANPNWLDCLFWLEELCEEGLIGHLGVTNFDTAHLQMATNSGLKIHSNQVCYSLLDQRASSSMTEFCLEQGIKILAFGTLAGGFLTDRWIDKPEPDLKDLATWSEMKYKRFIDTAGGWDHYQNVLKEVQDIANSLNVSIANIASRFILDNPAVGAIIVGARLGKSQHIQDNLTLFDVPLSSKHREQISNASRILDPIPGDCGDEYRQAPFLTASGDLSHHLQEMPPPFQTEEGPDRTTRVFSGTVWEKQFGYCRALKKGNRILVSGTTASHRDRLIGGVDPASQTHFVLDKIEGALQSLGAKLENVIRTRVYVNKLDDWESIAEVLGLRFKDIQPANTLVRAELIGSDYLVEIEAEAILDPTS